MIVSSQLFEAYLECSTKCWLRSRAEPVTGNVYAAWARQEKETYLDYGLKRLLATLQLGRARLKTLCCLLCRLGTCRIVAASS
jgi:hypothetical protein